MGRPARPWKHYVLKEDTRAISTWTLFEQLVQDVRYAARSMAANPLFTTMTVFLLALGIGANTAIYSFLDAIVMRALPVQSPEELVIFKWHTKDFPVVSHHFSGSSYKDPRTGFTSGNFPFPEFELLHRSANGLSDVFAFSGIGRIILQVTAAPGGSGTSWGTRM